MWRLSEDWTICLPLETDAIIGVCRPLVAFTEDIMEVYPNPWNKDRSCFQGLPHELSIECWQIDLSQITIRVLHRCYSMIGQFLRESTLVCAKCPFAPSTRFR